MSTASVLLRPLRAQILEFADADVTITFPAELPYYLGERLDGWETIAVRFASDLPLHSGWGQRFQLGPGNIRVAHTLGERITREQLEAGVAAYVRICRQLAGSP